MTDRYYTRTDPSLGLDAAEVIRAVALVIAAVEDIDTRAAKQFKLATTLTTNLPRVYKRI